ncbi:MAG: Gfo/Idh/MocA family oxidoreductase [Candidatus Hydrogenedentes bacterium]|nr:Gfo/Idh/MocA family oxidoreductase [Candidatus Hydrogenedentota bacterium]
MNRRDFLASAGTLTLAAATSSAGHAAEAKKYRACIIGDTKQGEYGHSLHMAFALRPDVEVVGLADPDEAGRAKHAAEAKSQRTYTDYREMLEKEKPDLVSIAPRWTIHHKEYLLAAAAVGAHGFLEKPISSDLVEADEMVRAVEAKNLKWAMAFNFRATPVIQHVRRLVVDETILGDVLEMRGRGKEDNRAGGEDLLVLGTHVFDMMRFLAGDPLWCTADITTEGRPARKEDVHEATEPLGPVVGDRIHAMYGFPRGVVGYFGTTKSKDGNGGRWGLDIYGSKGVMTIRADVTPMVSLLRDSSWAPGGKSVQWEPLPGAPDMSMKDPVAERNLPIINDLIASIIEDRRPKVSLQDGRDSLEMIQAVYDSYVQGRRVELPLKDRTHPLPRWG